ncbi:MAG: DUF3109 family protein [Prevotellaceae bacterium]|jgi:hypothetical protein|nr:DUF3109 family protein [Prevotellaceae bacterium]
MLQIDDKIISTDLLTHHFCCDLDVCAGVCCVYGDSGAPLEKEEEKILQQELPNFREYLTPKGRKAIERQGVAVCDDDGELVTPLVADREECAYSYFSEEGVCLCAIEKAFFEHKTLYRKPISCHLYPIRLKQMGDNLALNYDRQRICKPACSKGKEDNVPVFRFLKEPIIRKFGEGFYGQLEVACKLL